MFIGIELQIKTNHVKHARHTEDGGGAGGKQMSGYFTHQDGMYFADLFSRLVSTPEKYRLKDDNSHAREGPYNNKHRCDTVSNLHHDHVLFCWGAVRYLLIK